MRVTDLDPRWLTKDGKGVGVVFRNPVRAKWWTSCFFQPTPEPEQETLIEAALGPDANYQGCNPACGWTVAGDAEAATFEALSITPSLDGGPHFWHGHVTNGEIVGGLS